MDNLEQEIIRVKKALKKTKSHQLYVDYQKYLKRLLKQKKYGR